MQTNNCEVTKKFAQHKYFMSTGSNEWRDIKGEYEMIDDAVVGTVAYSDKEVRQSENLDGSSHNGKDLFNDKIKKQLEQNKKWQQAKERNER